jgi:hypothetical protein
MIIKSTKNICEWVGVALVEIKNNSYFGPKLLISTLNKKTTEDNVQSEVTELKI